MPNWCNNTITITGPEQKIRALWELANQKDGGLLSAMVPSPQELGETTAPNTDSDERQAELVEKYGFDNWYDWQVNNWGTKWDVSTEGLELSDDGTEITGWFDSAWSPPVSAYEFYGKANPDVKIEAIYHEPGMAYVGACTVEEGEADDSYYDYGDCNSNTVRDYIGETLDDDFGISEMMAEYESEEEEELTEWLREGAEKRFEA